MSSHTFLDPQTDFLDLQDLLDLLLDTFPGYIGLIGSFAGLLLMEILIFNPRLVQWSGG